MYPRRFSHQQSCYRLPSFSRPLSASFHRASHDSFTPVLCACSTIAYSRSHIAYHLLQGAYSHICCFSARVLFSPQYMLSKPSTISTGQLHTLLHFHSRPIKLVVSERSYSLEGMGSLILRWASHLDAFSGYPFRRSLLGCAAGATTDTRALRPPRSSRTRGSSSQTPYAHSG